MAPRREIIDNRILFEILSEVAVAGEEAYSAKIAERLGKEQSFIHRKLSELEKLGLVSSRKEKVLNKTIYEINYEGMNRLFYQYLEKRLERMISKQILFREKNMFFEGKRIVKMEDLVPTVRPLSELALPIQKSKFLRDVFSYGIRVKPTEFPLYHKLTLGLMFNYFVLVTTAYDFLFLGLWQKYRGRDEQEVIHAVSEFSRYLVAGDAFALYGPRKEGNNTVWGIS